MGDDQRWIVVTGEGEAAVTPDLAVVSMTVSRSATKLATARDDVNLRASAVLASLRELGIGDADLRAPDVVITPEYDYAKGRKLRGYAAARWITAKVRDLERLGPVLDGAVAAGANEMHGAQMGASDPSAAEHEALRKAVEAARAKAQVLADASGATLGSVARIEEAEAQMRPMPRAMGAIAEMAVPAPTEVEVGELTVARRVRVAFELT